MGLLEEIQRMRMSGMQDDQIVLKLQEQGNPYRAISEAMSQSKIKQAVEYQDQEPLPPIPSDVQQQDQQMQDSNEQNQYYEDQQMQEMQPSINQQSQEYQEQPQQQEYFSGYEPSQQTQDPQQNYDYNAGGLSSDTIMEISEQIVSEKLSDVRKKLENMSSFKTELETKAEALDDRLKRIEKIIDTLQSSVLRKVGDYVTNVEDIKRELIESQKTIAKAIGHKHNSKHKK